MLKKHYIDKHHVPKAITKHYHVEHIKSYTHAPFVRDAALAILDKNEGSNVMKNMRVHINNMFKVPHRYLFNHVCLLAFCYREQFDDAKTHTKERITQYINTCIQERISPYMYNEDELPTCIHYVTQFVQVDIPSEQYGDLKGVTVQHTQDGSFIQTIQFHHHDDVTMQHT